MSVNATYDFLLKKVHADVYVEFPNGIENDPRITAPPLYLLSDAADWEITWEIKLPLDVNIPVEFYEKDANGNPDGITFDEDSMPPRFQVTHSWIDASKKMWLATCNHQVLAANMVSYGIHLNVNGKGFMHDPSIAVTNDPIPPTLPWSPGGKGGKTRLAAQRVEEG
jgi:hypothetical protein